MRPGAMCATGRVVAAGARGGSPNAGPEAGTSVLGPGQNGPGWQGSVRNDPPGSVGRPGSWVDPGLPADPVRKRRRALLLAGGGVAALAVAALIIWGLADRRGPAERATSGAAGGLTSAAPSDAARPSPSVNGGDPATLPSGSGGSGHPMLGVTGSTASLGPSAAPTTTSAGGAPRPSGEPSALAPTGPVGTRLSSAGGVVYAVCSQGKGQLTSWEPNPGYTVQKVNPGPALAPEIVFKGTLNRYRMTVTCVAGTPTPLVLPL